VKLLIVDDHSVVRAGILATLKENNLFDQFLECDTGEEALRLAEEEKPGYIFLDLSLPGKHGLVVLKELRENKYRGKIICLTFHQEDEYLFKAYQMGANGYVKKASAISGLNNIITRIENGESFAVDGYNDEELDTIIRMQKVKTSVSKEFYGDVFLTAREREVLNGVLAGKTSAELAEEMGISIRTIHIYRGNLLSKYESKNMTELAGKVLKGE